jgi:Family of unknown function (DUF6527)
MASLGRIPWWQWIPGRRWRIVAAVEDADEIPSRLPRNGVVLVGSRQQPKWLAFDCPCRTGHRIIVSLDVTHTPHWILVDERDLTVWPSLDYRAHDRRCHYIISYGRVVWTHEKECTR